MKLKFYWYISEAFKDDILRPACTVVDSTSELDECLANYLMDDGGQTYLNTISWLDEGIKKMDSIKNGEADIIDWSRNAWGAEISSVEAKIYSLYDENYFEIVSLNAFEKALLSWKEFLQLKPHVDNSLEIDLGDCCKRDGSV